MSNDLHAYAADLARQAGVLAREGFQRFDIGLKDDGTEVTETDAAVEGFIRQQIAERFPDDLFLGEETSQAEEFTALAGTGAGRVWVVDPIDGTASFARGLPVWGVSIAVFEAGAVIAGCFHNPLTGEMFATCADGGAVSGARALRCAGKAALDRDDLMLVLSRFHSRFRTDFPGKTRSLGSTAAHLCYLASGAASAMFVTGAGLWDIAAGYEIARRAGACFRYLDGRECRLEDFFSGERGAAFVASTPDLIDDVLGCIKPL